MASQLTGRAKAVDFVRDVNVDVVSPLTLSAENSDGLRELSATVGGILNVVTKNTNYTATLSDDVILCTGTLTLDLPTAAGNDGKQFWVKVISSGKTVTISAFGVQTIDGSGTIDLSVHYDSVHLVAGNGVWHVTGGMYATKMNDLIKFLPDDERDIIITRPDSGEYHVYAIAKLGTKLKVCHLATPEP